MKLSEAVDMIGDAEKMASKCRKAAMRSARCGHGRILNDAGDIIGMLSKAYQNLAETAAKDAGASDMLKVLHAENEKYRSALRFIMEMNEDRKNGESVSSYGFRLLEAIRKVKEEMDI